MPAAESGPVEAVEIPKLKLGSHELQRTGSIRTKNAIEQTQQRATPKFGTSASSPKIGGDDRGVAHATEQTKQRAALKPKFGTSASSPSKIGGDDRGVAHATEQTKQRASTTPKFGASASSPRIGGDACGVAHAVEQTKQRATPKFGASASSPRVGGDAFGVAHCRAQTEQRKPTNAVSDNLGRSRGSSLADDAFMAHACKMTKDKAHTRKPDPPRAPMWDSLAPAPSASYEAPGSKTFSYDELKGVIPAGVDPAKKEQYLSDADFENIMKSPRSVFNDMKAWKQAQVKKTAGLY